MAIDWHSFYEGDGNMACRLHANQALKLTPPVTVFILANPHGEGPPGFTWLGAGGTLFSMGRSSGAFARFDTLYLEAFSIGGIQGQLLADRAGGVVSQAGAYSDPFTLEGWHSFCGVYDQAFAQCYVDGLPSGSPSTYSVWPNLTPGDTIIGARGFYVGPQYIYGFGGCYALFAAFNWRLSDAEVAHFHANLSIEGLCELAAKNPITDVLSYVRFDDKATGPNEIYGPTFTPSAGWNAAAYDCADAPTSPPVPPIYGSLSWEKRNALGGGLLGGATFRVEPDPFNLVFNTDHLDITDNDANDADLTDGQFKLDNIANLRTYTITEIQAPEGYDVDEVDFRTIYVEGDTALGTMGIDDDDDFHDEIITVLVGGNSCQMCTNLLLYVPHTHELDKAGLKSFLEIGPFRFAEQQQADETSMVSSLIVGSTDAEIGVVTTLDLNTSDLPDEDWDTKVDVFGDDIAVDWGIGGGNSDDYTLRLFSHDDGMDHHTLGMPEALEPIEDLGSAKVYAPYGYSGIWHRFRFEADEEDEGFQIKYIDVGGTLTGRRL